MKHCAYLLMALLLITTAEAKKKGGKNNKAAEQKEKAEQAEKAENETKRNAVNDFLASKDSNGDNSLTLDEYLQGESDPEAATKKFDEFNRNKDRYLSKGEIKALLGL